MRNELGEVLAHIGQTYQDNISDDSRFYREVDIGRQAQKLGYRAVNHEYQQVCALVPLKRPVGGMKVRIDGRTFVNYAQFASGVVVPNYVAKKAGLPYKDYRPNDSMILNFA